MNERIKINVLKKIANELNRMNVTWSLGASMLLYFKGIIKEFKDIDLMVVDKDIDLAIKILNHLGELQTSSLNSKYRTKVFLEYVIDEVDVDVMCGFSIMNKDTLIDCSLNKEQIVEFYDLDGVKIPLQSVSLWRHYYELMGRDDRVDMIKNSIRRSIK